MSKPKITIFTVTYHRLKFTQMWAASFVISLDLNNYDYEVFVVDNGSSDGTKEFLLEYLPKYCPIMPNIVLRKDNIGFGGAFHEQFDKFTGDFFVHYASDIISEAGWTKAMHNHFIKEERLAMLAPFYKNNGNNPMVGAIAHMKKHNIDMKNRNLWFSGKDFPTNCADGFSMMRMSALRDIGGYHVKRIYGGHDACLSKQYWAKNWLVGFTSDWTVEHLLPTPDMKGYEIWKQESQQRLKRIGVESSYNQDKGYYDA